MLDNFETLWGLWTDFYLTVSRILISKVKCVTSHCIDLNISTKIHTYILSNACCLLCIFKNETSYKDSIQIVRTIIYYYYYYYQGVTDEHFGDRNTEREREILFTNNNMPLLHE